MRLAKGEGRHDRVRPSPYEFLTSSVERVAGGKDYPITEKSLSAELKASLSACTFADLARAVEPFSRRWRATPSCARAAEAFEALPAILRKRLGNLRVLDSVAAVRCMADLAAGKRSRCPSVGGPSRRAP